MYENGLSSLESRLLFLRNQLTVWSKQTQTQPLICFLSQTHNTPESPLKMDVPERQKASEGWFGWGEKKGEININIWAIELSF